MKRSWRSFVRWFGTIKWWSFRCFATESGFYNSVVSEFAIDNQGRQRHWRRRWWWWASGSMECVQKVYLVHKLKTEKKIDSTSILPLRYQLWWRSFADGHHTRHRICLSSGQVFSSSTIARRKQKHPQSDRCRRKTPKSISQGRSVTAVTTTTAPPKISDDLRWSSLVMDWNKRCASLAALWEIIINRDFLIGRLIL